MEISGKRVIILVEQQFNDHEFWYPYYRMLEAGASVTIVGSGAAIDYKGKDGTQAKSDKAADQINPSDFEAIIIPGGFAPDFMRRNKAMVNLVKTMADTGKTVAAICHAGWMLASAKILKGRKATSFFAIRDDMENAGAIWLDEEVVIDGKLVTSRTPADLPAFMKAVLKSISA